MENYILKMTKMKKIIYILLILTACTTTNVTEKTVIIYDTIPYPVPYFDTSEIIKYLFRDSVKYSTYDSVKIKEVEIEKINWIDSMRFIDIEIPILKPYIDTFYTVVQDTAKNIIKTYNWFSNVSWIDNYTLLQDDNLSFHGYFEHYNDSLIGTFSDRTSNFDKKATFIFHKLDSIEIEITNRADTNKYFIDFNDPFGNCPDTVTIRKTGWMYLTNYDTIKFYDTTGCK